MPNSPSLVERLGRLRRLPRDLFSRIDDVSSQVTVSNSEVAELRKQLTEVVQEFSGMREQINVSFEKRWATADARSQEQTELIGSLQDFQDQLTKVILMQRTSDKKSQSVQAELHGEVQRVLSYLDSFASKFKEAFSSVTKRLDETLTGATIGDLTKTIETKFAELDQRSSEVWRGHADDLAALRTIVDAQKHNFEDIRGTIAAQAVVMPSWFWDEATGKEVRSILRPLMPARVEHHAKIRLGRPHDGGYVMIDDWNDIDAALSLGIKDDVSWDAAVAERHIDVYQYDHTIEKLPQEDPHFHWHRLRIAVADGEGACSLDTILSERKSEGAKAIVLKIDIESDEWRVLEAADLGLLSLCRQMVCEFHFLHRLADPEFRSRAQAVFRRLCEIFFVCHVHGNNCGNMVNVANVALPDNLEVTFANRNHYQSAESGEIFPTEIDMPNQKDRADLFLGSFRF